MLTPILLASAELLAGVLLLIRGLRRRLLDDHPVCRKCSFDLFGRPEESTRCSECGADLGKAGAVRVGNRQRRWRVAGLGAMVVAMGAVSAGGMGWMSAKGIDVNHYKPVWLLLRESTGNNEMTRNGAVGELWRRVNAGKLTGEKLEEVAEWALAQQRDPQTPWTQCWDAFFEAALTNGSPSKDKWDRYRAQGADRLMRDEALVELLWRVEHWQLTGGKLDEVVDHALARQADLSKPWEWQWARIFELARESKRVSQEQWDRYVLQSPLISMEVRPQVRRGALVPLRLGYISRGKYRDGMYVKSTRLVVTLDGAPIVLTMDLGFPVQRVTDTPSEVNAFIQPDQFPSGGLKEGMHTLAWSLDFEAFEDNPESNPQAHSSGTDHRDLEAKFEVVNHEAVRLVKNPKLANSMKDSVKLGELVLQANGGVSVSVTLDHPPVSVACDLFLKHRYGEWPTQWIALKAGAKVFDVTGPPQIGALPSLDVILRPRRELAEQTIDITEIWGDEIIWRNVPVKLP